MFSGGRDGISGVIRIGPGVRAARKASICKVIEDALVRVLLRAHENETAIVMSRRRERANGKLTALVYVDIRCR